MFIIGVPTFREEVGYALAAAVCLQLTAKSSLELRTGYGMAHRNHLCTLANKIQDSYAGCWGVTGFEILINIFMNQTGLYPGLSTEIHVLKFEVFSTNLNL